MLRAADFILPFRFSLGHLDLHLGDFVLKLVLQLGQRNDLVCQLLNQAALVHQLLFQIFAFALQHVFLHGVHLLSTAMASQGHR